ncbi:hypothetical protein [Mycetohabitans endofungorum]|nr:hypothetical protein [Mycetohabitans endofungorum]
MERSDGAHAANVNPNADIGGNGPPRQIRTGIVDDAYVYVA